MQKYFLLTILFVTIILGCGKNIEPEPTKIAISFDGEELIVNDYLSQKDLELYTNHIIVKDLFFYAYGFKDNKLYIKGFNIHTKQNIWSFVSKTDFNFNYVYTLSYGFGDVKTLSVLNSQLERIFKYENNYAFIIYDWLEYFHIPKQLFIVSNGTESVINITSTTFNIIDDFPNTYIYNWYGNTFLLYIIKGSSGYIKSRIIKCYSYSGNMLYETQNPQFYPNRADIESYSFRRDILSISYHPLNLNECLYYDDNNGRFFIRYNVKENKEVWKSKELMRPSNVRINSQKFEIIDKDFTKYTLDYTTYEGDKKVLSVKINNNTGEFVQL